MAGNNWLHNKYPGFGPGSTSSVANTNPADANLMNLLNELRTGESVETLPSIVNRFEPGVSEEVPMQQGYSDQYGTYDEYGNVVDYYLGTSPTGGVAEPRGAGGAHDSINMLQLQNDPQEAIKNNPSLLNSLLQHIMSLFK